jgi:hypothetical protein
MQEYHVLPTVAIVEPSSLPPLSGLKRSRSADGADCNLIGHRSDVGLKPAAEGKAQGGGRAINVQILDVRGNERSCVFHPEELTDAADGWKRLDIKVRIPTAVPTSSHKKQCYWKVQITSVGLDGTKQDLVATAAPNDPYKFFQVKAKTKQIVRLEPATSVATTDNLTHARYETLGFGPLLEGDVAIQLLPIRPSIDKFVLHNTFGVSAPQISTTSTNTEEWIDFTS